MKNNQKILALILTLSTFLSYGNACTDQGQDLDEESIEIAKRMGVDLSRALFVHAQKIERNDFTSFKLELGTRMLVLDDEVCKLQVKRLFSPPRRCQSASCSGSEEVEQQVLTFVAFKGPTAACSASEYPKSFFYIDSEISGAELKSINEYAEGIIFPPFLRQERIQAARISAVRSRDMRSAKDVVSLEFVIIGIDGVEETYIVDLLMYERKVSNHGDIVQYEH